MVLHNLLFPSVDCDREALFFRTEGPAFYCLGDAAIRCEKGAHISLNAYFSAFSIGKWMKYSHLSSLTLTLSLSGSFHISIRHAECVRGEMVSQTILTHTHSRADGQLCSLEINAEKENGVYYAYLTCLEDDSAYLGGAFETDAPNAKEIRLALCICTYKREAYINRNIERLRREIFEQEHSPLRGKIELFIADNGQTLPGALSTENIHIFPNKNAGGSGGFARAMIEVLKSGSGAFTHVVMMDDDITLPTETLLRTAAFLALLKENYGAAFLGAAMLELDRPEIQTTQINNWAGGSSIAVKAGYDLSLFDNVLRNEVEETANHFGWWYCAMPIGVVREDNLPLPLFIKRDDVEYSVRERPPLITLNGVCVWHETFVRKRSAHLEYYFWRNTCIISALHRPSYEKNGKKLRRDLKRYIAEKCDMLRYKDAYLALRGVEDFLKGPDFLRDADPSALNASVIEGGYKAVPIKQIKATFRLNAYEQSLEKKPEGKLRAFFRALTLNGQLLKAVYQPTVPAVNAQRAQLYRAKSALYYAEAGETGFLVKKSWKERFRVFRKYYAVRRAIAKRHEGVSLEYKRRFRELTSLKFWETYLSEEHANALYMFSNAKRPARSPKQFLIDYVKFGAIFAIRLIQHLLAFLPVKKDKITLCVYGRKGYSCNPKAILDYVQNEHPGRYLITWATQYPMSCDELREMGIRVVAYQSLSHLLSHFTSKYLIVNDRVPSYFVVRKKQVLVNVWHGGMNYKRIGLDTLKFSYRFEKIVYNLQNIRPDIFVSGSRFFTQNTAKSFGFDERIFLPSGLPRNDILLKDSARIAEGVKARLSIPEGMRVLLYAPTFRNDLSKDTHGLDFKRALGALKQRFGGDWALLFRAHGFAEGQAKLDFENIIDASAYPDMQELLCASDALISDYSSCMWDYCLLRRPMFCYAPDFDRYRQKERDFAYPPDRWPIPVSPDNDALCETILSFDENAFLERVKGHIEDAGGYDRGDAAKRVYEAMTGLK